MALAVAPVRALTALQRQQSHNQRRGNPRPRKWPLAMLRATTAMKMWHWWPATAKATAMTNLTRMMERLQRQQHRHSLLMLAMDSLSASWTRRWCRMMMHHSASGLILMMGPCA